MGIDEMISFGGGVNSTAMTILLVEQGWRGPIVFCDVGDESQPCEHPETLCYLNYFEREYLRPRGLELTRLRPGDEWHSKKAQTGLYTYCLNAGIIPLASIKWCSAEWKRDVMARWQKAHGIDVACVGIDTSETRRARDDDMTRYPLIEAGFSRNTCHTYIERAGLAVPRKSGCFFCPGQGLGGWRRLFIDAPDLYALAEALEENATRRAHERGWKGGNATLDAHGESLAEMRFRRAWDGQLEMDLPGMARPCICGL